MTTHTQQPPVIIIGMHRSGTTMISEMLTDLGLFQGYEKDPNHEALFFLEINEWLLRTAGGAWDYPLPFKLLLDNRQVCEQALRFMRERLQKRHAVSFFGRAPLSIKSRPAAISGPWGWKDPRNTFTLPLWLQIFPDARVIHICRHGVDVAASLLHRNEKVLGGQLTEAGRSGISRKNPLVDINPILVDTIRCGSLEGGFTLWEEYMAEARRQLDTCGAPVMDIRYEDFLEAPEDSLAALAEFCSLGATADACRTVAATARKSRALSYKSNPELAGFADSVAARLAPYGY